MSLRANSVLQARVREAQYSRSECAQAVTTPPGAQCSSILKKDLGAEAVAWRQIPSDLRESDFKPSRTPNQDSTTYSVDSPLQAKLAAVRTDLDSFNNVEAYALMASGYRMANAQLANGSDISGFRPAAVGAWKFKDVGRAIQPNSVEPGLEAQRLHVGKILDASASVAFRMWKLSRRLRVATAVVAAVPVAVLLWLLYQAWETPVLEILPARMAKITVGAVGISIFLVVARHIVNRMIGKRHGGASDGRGPMA